MTGFPKNLSKKLEDRKLENGLRSFVSGLTLIDFSSNDYLGFSREKAIEEKAGELLRKAQISQNGATGSRLLSGNHLLYNQLEEKLCAVHRSEAALIFNSGYDANLGFFASVPQRSDIIIYDEFCHASIRDGIRLSNSKSFKFKHNSLDDLKRVVEKTREHIVGSELYVVTESVFSMHGDSPDLEELVGLCKKEGLHLIVDEAHAVGVFGYGLLNEHNIGNDVFARIVTFGKALGVHGAAILGSVQLRSYLINFARSLVYTTALPPHTLATVFASYEFLNSPEGSSRVQSLHNNIRHFNEEAKKMELNSRFGKCSSPIKVCKVQGSGEAKVLSKLLIGKGFDVRAILSPTVPRGQERLRICLHAFNDFREISTLLQIIKKNLNG